MKKIKKLVALFLTATMIMSLSACGKEKDESTSKSLASGEKRIINIGTWYAHYYDSSNTDIYDDPTVSDEEVAQMHFDAVKKVEEKYNCEVHWVNLTYTGIQESINTSILAGTPDCDIYEADVNFAIPAAVNGYASNLKDILPENSDVLNEKKILRPFSIGDSDDVLLFKPVSQEAIIEATYPIAYNKAMIDEAGLEDPCELYEKGEWTWDKFKEYMITLTKDNDGDGTPDVYGFGSDVNNLLDGLMMSNGTGIAQGTQQNLTSPEVGECLDFMFNMYNVDNCAYPWYEDDFDTNRLWYKDGLVAFWVSAAWIMDANKDADLGIETTFVPWPVGPSGDKVTNKMKNIASGNVYMIPEGVEDPEFVYNVFNDLMNWYDGDAQVRDGDMSWWENSVITEENYQLMELMGQNENFDLWNVFLSQTKMDLAGLVTGQITPAQLQETYKQPYQDVLNTFYNQ